MTVAATVVVQFGEGVDSSALVVIELDGTMNLTSDGEEKTSFNPGDQPYFLVHYDTAALKIGAVKSSSGMVAGGNVVTRERAQQLQFIEKEESQDLPHIPTDNVSFTWYGNAPHVTQNGKSLVVNADELLPAICEAKYSISAKQYQLIPPTMVLDEDETYPVLVVVYMEAP